MTRREDEMQERIFAVEGMLVKAATMITEARERAEAAEKREAVLREHTLDAIAMREAALKVLNEIANAHAESREDAWRLRKIARAALEAKP